MPILKGQTMDETLRQSYEMALAGLESERDEIEAAIMALRRRLGIVTTQGTAVSAPTVGGTAATDIPRKAFIGLSVPDAIKGFLKATNAKRTVKQIAEGLIRGGFHTTSKFFQANVSTTLRRMEDAGDAVKIDEEWGLAEWYPGLRGKKQPPAKSSARPKETAHGEPAQVTKPNPIPRAPSSTHSMRDQVKIVLSNSTHPMRANEIATAINSFAVGEPVNMASLQTALSAMAKTGAIRRVESGLFAA